MFIEYQIVVAIVSAYAHDSYGLIKINAIETPFVKHW